MHSGKHKDVASRWRQAVATSESKQLAAISPFAAIATSSAGRDDRGLQPLAALAEEGYRAGSGTGKCSRLC